MGKKLQNLILNCISHKTLKVLDCNPKDLFLLTVQPTRSALWNQSVRNQSITLTKTSRVNRQLNFWMQPRFGTQIQGDKVGLF